MTEMTDYYNGIADGYDELHKEEQLNKLSIISKIGVISKEDKLLDVGCGTAFSLDYFDVNEAVGIDPSDKLVEKYSGKHEVLVGPAENLLFKDSEFDVVISMTAIQNFDNIKKGLQEIRRVGKDRFVLTYLKKSPKAQHIEELLKDIFSDFEILVFEEEKDMIFLISSDC